MLGNGSKTRSATRVLPFNAGDDDNGATTKFSNSRPEEMADTAMHSRSGKRSKNGSAKNRSGHFAGWALISSSIKKGMHRDHDASEGGDTAMHSRSDKRSKNGSAKMRSGRFAGWALISSSIKNGMHDHDASEEEDAVSRQVSTAVKEQYDMWVLPLHEFVGLSTLEPHQALLRKGKLARWDPSMKHVFFLSHQWTSFDHPDHTGAQLRTMQHLFLECMSGNVSDTTPDFQSRVYMPSGATLSRKEWRRIVTDGRAFVWPVACISILQCVALSSSLGKYYDGTRSEDNVSQNDLISAVNSIPAYIERCTHFFAVCPAIQHKDLPDVVCDFGSWLQRAWCNLELYALQLARFGKLPAIVVQGGQVAPYLMSPTTASARLPGHGTLTCCARKHVLRDADGVEYPIPCDRYKIGEVLVTMLVKRQNYHLEREELDLYRMWLAAMPMVLSALPAHETAVDTQRSVAEFRRAYKYKLGASGGAREPYSPPSSSRCNGLTPAHLAAWAGNAAVLSELLHEEEEAGGTPAVVANARTYSDDHTFGFDEGFTPLHLAVVGFRYGTSEVEAMVTALLEAGADPNAATKSGATPLMGAVIYRNLGGVRALLKCARGLDLERGLRINHATALGIAAYFSTEAIVEALLEAGADRTSVNDAGGNKLHDACANPAAGSGMLALLWRGPTPDEPGTLLLDVNATVRPQTRKWGAIQRVFRIGIRSGALSRTAFNLSVAHAGGATPLHHAAQHGNVAHVRWLLAHGAHESLRVRNSMGATPVQPKRQMPNACCACLHPSIRSCASSPQFGQAARGGGYLRAAHRGGVGAGRGDARPWLRVPLPSAVSGLHRR